MNLHKVGAQTGAAQKRLANKFDSFFKEISLHMSRRSTEAGFMDRRLKALKIILGTHKAEEDVEFSRS